MFQTKSITDQIISKISSDMTQIKINEDGYDITKQILSYKLNIIIQFF